jgi:hypothetical protein
LHDWPGEQSQSRLRPHGEQDLGEDQFRHR